MNTTPSAATPPAPTAAHRVVIVGGGFGGLYAAKSLRGAAVDVLLLDRRNFHLFQPLLYQVATGGLSPANIAYPLRAAVKRQRNVRVQLGEVTDVDAANRLVRLADREIPFDTLVVAAGAVNSYFGNDAWETDAPGLKSLEDATTIRSRVLLAFEAAEKSSDAAETERLLSFVVIGGGPTGVELAGTLAEIARHTLRHEFRTIDPSLARIVLLEGGPRVLPAYPPKLSDSAQRTLERLGVRVLCGAMVTDITSEGVTYARDGAAAQIAARTVLWGAGVRGSPLGAALARATGAELDRAGRVIVGRDCTIPGHPSIFVIGDLALFRDEEGSPLPGTAPVAMQQGRFVAGEIRRRLAGKRAEAFRYEHRGSMATIGRAAAVADLGWARFSGLPAWLAWLLIHIVFLIEFQNRLLVLTQWAWNYFTWDRAARLITQYPPSEPEPPAAPPSAPSRSSGRGARSRRGSRAAGDTPQ